MTKRAFAAYLWIAAGWSLGSVMSEVTGLSEYFGLVVGVALAVVVLVMPAEIWTRRVSLSWTVRESESGPLPLPQTR